jgi:hypothetical protein
MAHVKIAIAKKTTRNRLTCTRADGTCEHADLGPALPHHDLAHFVVERRLGLKQGFFGRIARGYSVAQLSDKEVIKSSPAESLVAEVAARALQSLSSGACTSSGFLELVNTELAHWSIAPLNVEIEAVEGMRAEFEALLGSYSALRPGDTMCLEFLEPAVADK